MEQERGRRRRLLTKRFVEIRMEEEVEAICPVESPPPPLHSRRRRREVPSPWSELRGDGHFWGGCSYGEEKKGAGGGLTGYVGLVLELSFASGVNGCSCKKGGKRNS